jgi:hypothetical protein
MRFCFLFPLFYLMASNLSHSADRKYGVVNEREYQMGDFVSPDAVLALSSSTYVVSAVECVKGMEDCHMSLIGFDSEDDMVWKKQIRMGEHRTYAHKLLKAEKEFIVVGGYSNTDSIEEAPGAFIAKVGFDGVLISTAASLPFDVPRDALRGADGKIFTVGLMSYGGMSGRRCVGMLTPDGETVWSKCLDDIDGETGFNSAVFSSSNVYLAAGYAQTLSPGDRTIVTAFSGKGELLWERQINVSSRTGQRILRVRHAYLVVCADDSDNNGASIITIDSAGRVISRKDLPVNLPRINSANVFFEAWAESYLLGYIARENAVSEVTLISLDSSFGLLSIDRFPGDKIGGMFSETGGRLKLVYRARSGSRYVLKIANLIHKQP